MKTIAAVWASLSLTRKIYACFRLCLGISALALVALDLAGFFEEPRTAVLVIIAIVIPIMGFLVISTKPQKDAHPHDTAAR